MTRDEERAIIAQAEAQAGLQPGLLDSIWKQESGRSSDLGLLGKDLSRGRGNATGPFQIVPYYHPTADMSSFASQAQYAADYLKKVGVREYYGEGSAPAGHPTTDQYEAQVMGRLNGGNNRGTSVNRIIPGQSGGLLAQQPQQQAQQGILGSQQGLQGLLGTSSPRRAAWLADFAAGINTTQPGLGGVAAGLSSANKSLFDRELRQTKQNTMTPYQQASIRIQQQQQQAQQAQRRQELQVRQGKAQQLAQSRKLVADRLTDPAQKQLVLSGAMDDKLGKLAGMPTPANAKEVASARQEFARLPEVRRYKAASGTYDQLSTVLAATENPYAALSTVFLFMKALDPESVVRESEQGTFVEAGGAASSIASQFNKLLGEGRMNDKARKQIMQSARDLVEGAHKSASETQDRFSRIAKEQYGTDEYYVVGDDFGVPELPEWAKADALRVPGVKPSGRGANPSSADELLERMNKFDSQKPLWMSGGR